MTKTSTPSSAPAVTNCWNCGLPYHADAEQCGACNAVNANRDLARAQHEMESKAAGFKPLPKELTAVQIKSALMASAMDYGRAVADDIPKSQQMWLDDIKEKMHWLEARAFGEGLESAKQERIPVPTKALELLEQALELAHGIWLGDLNKDDREGIAFNLKFAVRDYLREVGYLMKAGA